MTLLDTSPPIWRRIRGRDCDLDQLHRHFRAAMGWTDSHRHHFRPVLVAETFGELDHAASTTGTWLGDLPTADGAGASFEYEYDFGDGWLHEVRVEAREAAEPRKRYPLCLEGERACPPEDVGGAWGYADFLAVLADPGHERHEEALWIGRRFDPEAFDPAKASTEMRGGLAGR